MTRSHAARRVAAVSIAAGAGLAIALPAIGATLGGTVTAGGPATSDHSELQAYYPGTLTVYAGDTVRFPIQGFHTVTIVPRGRSAPPILIPTGQNAAPANDPGGQPYWWGAAGVPQFAFNPAAAAPSGPLVARPGRIVNSGFPQGRRPSFTFRFPRPGVYTYNCIPHPTMSGTIRVLPASARPGAAALARKRAADARRAAAERARDLAAERRARRAAERRRGGTTVTVGVGTRRYHSFAFYPSRLTVRAGTTVDFRWGGKSEIHTVTFGPAAQQDRLIRAFETARLIPAEVQYPSDPPGAPPAVTATAHGVGLVNSGILFDPGTGPPGQPSRFRATFPEPGTFTYICVIHGRLMKGTITVIP